MKYSNIIGLCIFIIVSVMIYHSCGTMKAKPCKQCPSYTEYWVQQSDSLKRELAACSEECDRLNDENQFYGSMLGEIESVPGGSEILDTLFNQLYTK